MNAYRWTNSVSIPLWFDSNGIKMTDLVKIDPSLNSTMVRFKLNKYEKIDIIIGMSQFHYGSIQIQFF